MAHDGADGLFDGAMPLTFCWNILVFNPAQGRRQLVEIAGPSLEVGRQVVRIGDRERQRCADSVQIVGD